MDVRGLQITSAFAEKSAGSDPSFLSGHERALSNEMAPCRSQAMATRTACDAGTLSAGGACVRFLLSRMFENKNLDFRI